MSTGLQVINPLHYGQWDELVTSLHNWSFFHLAEWAQVLTKTYHYRPVYFMLQEQARVRVLVPVMEVKSCLTGTRGVSLPFSDFCEPYIERTESCDAVLQQIIEYGQQAQWKYIALRGGTCFSSQHKQSSFCYDHTLDLNRDTQELFAGLKGSTRRNIRKAQRSGIRVEQDNSVAAVKAFYQLNCLTRKRHGLPPQPFSFFKNIHSTIFNQHKGDLFLAYDENRIIAGAMFFHHKEKVLYKFGASRKNAQQFRPNDLIMWRAIEHYANNGGAELSLGRTEPGHNGLRAYKRGWGTQEQVRKYYTYNIAQHEFVADANRVSGSHNALFRIMPVALLRLTGTLLYRHAG